MRRLTCFLHVPGNQMKGFRCGKDESMNNGEQYLSLADGHNVIMAELEN